MLTRPHSDTATTATRTVRVVPAVMPRVLVVDDDELVLERLQGLVVAAGYEVATAGDANSALAALQARFAPIIILDRQMPGMDGLALCRMLREQSWPGYIYILLLTAHDSEEDILSGLEAGADDYLGKRTSGAQLLARLHTARRILALEQSLVEALEEKRRLSLTDPLTGLANRRYFVQHLSRALRRAQRIGEPLSLLALDLDFFKNINDRHGHLAGDAVLEEFARRLSGCLRRGSDLCARTGGEEFAVVLSGTRAAEARRLAESIRARVQAKPVHTDAVDIPITVSIGISAWEPDGAAPNQSSLLQQADAALYASKAAGRNRVSAAGRG